MLLNLTLANQASRYSHLIFQKSTNIGVKEPYLYYNNYFIVFFYINNIIAVDRKNTVGITQVHLYGLLTDELILV